MTPPAPASDPVREAAAWIARHRLEHRPLPAPPEHLRPRDEVAAYAVQHALHRELAAAGLGERVGWKIGCTNPQMQRYLGIRHPAGGGVMAETVHLGTGRFRHADFVRPGVEVEIAVRLGSTLHAADGPFRGEDMVTAVDEVMPAIEIVDDRYVDRAKLDTPTLIADDFFDAAAVLGPARKLTPALDLAELAGEVRINGETCSVGRGRDILGHPLEALAWLASHRSACGGVLRAGEFVLLGSVTAIQWVARGAEIEGAFDGLGAVRAVIG